MNVAPRAIRAVQAAMVPAHGAARFDHAPTRLVRVAVRPVRVAMNFGQGALRLAHAAAERRHADRVWGATP